MYSTLRDMLDFPRLHEHWAAMCLCLCGLSAEHLSLTFWLTRMHMKHLHVESTYVCADGRPMLVVAWTASEVQVHGSAKSFCRVIKCVYVFWGSCCPFRYSADGTEVKRRWSTIRVRNAV
jgi:hypothetical protein